MHEGNWNPTLFDLLDAESDSHSWSVLEAQRAIAAAGRGVIVLLHRTESPQELRRRAIAGDSSPSQKMDLRNYGIGAQILRDLHVGKMRLLARPRKMPSMAGFDLEVTGYGEWRLKRQARKAGAQPDECYIIGRDKRVPDLAIEIEWSRVVGLEKHQIYERLGVRELWTLRRDGSLVIRVLEKGRYHERKRSAVFPSLDVQWLRSFLELPTQTDAVRALRKALRT